MILQRKLHLKAAHIEINGYKKAMNKTVDSIQPWPLAEVVESMRDNVKEKSEFVCDRIDIDLYILSRDLRKVLTKI